MHHAKFNYDVTIANEQLCGCYALNPVVRSNAFALPLKHIDYDIEIANNLAKIAMVQEFQNSTSSLLELDYFFPMDAKCCIYKFIAIFDKKQIVGIIKEKEQAKKEFKEALDQGKQAGYAEIDTNFIDTLRINLGNIPPKCPLIIRIQYLQELEVSMNTFWKLKILSSKTPRTAKKSNCTHTFKVKLNVEKPITYFKSPTHDLTLISDHDKKQMLLALKECSIAPFEDFTFLFSTQQFQKPQYVVGKTDCSTSVHISLIPKFCALQGDDAYQMEVKNKQYEINIESARGEYIFLLDRSGSMSGSRINRAKEALVLFLKSLPQDCYFNVYSFGSTFTKIYERSVKYADNTLTDTLNKLSTFKADMASTQIYAPLYNIFESAKIKNYPRNVYLLTDGDVTNPTDVLLLIKRNTRNTRVHAIGIGSDASPKLIKQGSKLGKGKHVFISDNDNTSQKIIELLDTSLSPLVYNVNLEFDANIVDMMVPNPNDLDYILKNEPLNISIIFKDSFKGHTDFTLSYQDTSGNKYKQKIIVDTNKSQSYDFVDKLIHHRSLCIMAQSLKDKTNINSDIFFSEAKDISHYIVAQSVKHQVLTEKTAFISVGKALSDLQYQKYLKATKFKIQEIKNEWAQLIDLSVDQIQRKPDLGDLDNIKISPLNIMPFEEIKITNPNYSTLLKHYDYKPHQFQIEDNKKHEVTNFYGNLSSSRAPSSSFSTGSSTGFMLNNTMPPPPPLPTYQNSYLPPPPSYKNSYLPPPPPSYQNNYFPPPSMATISNSNMPPPPGNFDLKPKLNNLMDFNSTKTTSTHSHTNSLFGMTSNISSTTSNRIPSFGSPPTQSIDLLEMQPPPIKNKQVNTVQIISDTLLNDAQCHKSKPISNMQPQSNQNPFSFSTGESKQFNYSDKPPMLPKQLLAKDIVQTATKLPSTEIIKKLITLQKFDGRFELSGDLQTLLYSIGISIEKFNEKAKKFNKDLVFTIVAQRWISVNYNTTEYALIIKKAVAWIKQQELLLSSEQIIQLECI